MAAFTITDAVAVDDDELRLSFARSGGPGGQHVNTSSTRVDLWFDVAGSPSLSPEQKQRIRQQLRGRLTDRGVLRLSSSTHRSQLRNREDVLERFRSLLAQALAPPPPTRRPTRATAAARRRRVEDKRRRGSLKQSRGRVDGE